MVQAGRPANGPKGSYLHLNDEITVNAFIIHVSFGRIMMMKLSVAADTDLILLQCKMCERSRAAATQISRLDLLSRSMWHCCLPIKNKK
jgi:hypothetical protein